ncbi:hypothetical protein BRD00_06425 [Halobacteriales archaeon QS_8_69_26]|nr:MAG: hypothetical protein BRD00_06425 [Halobacteriales archaeon QS_8_69_26]
MTCMECGRGLVGFTVPEDLREYLPENASAAAVCLSCLTLQPPTEETPTPKDPDLTQVSESLTDDPDVAIPMVIAVGLLESLALNRPKIERLIERIEREGVDPMLVLEDLANDPSLNPAIDLVGRRRQLQQLLDA